MEGIWVDLCVTLFCLEVHGGSTGRKKALKRGHCILGNPGHLCVWCKKSIWKSVQTAKDASNACAVLC